VSLNPLIHLPSSTVHGVVFEIPVCGLETEGIHCGIGAPARRQRLALARGA
jgi:hypothetical protein